MNDSAAGAILCSDAGTKDKWLFPQIGPDFGHSPGERCPGRLITWLNILFIFSWGFGALLKGLTSVVVLRMDESTFIPLTDNYSNKSFGLVRLSNLLQEALGQQL